MELQILKPTNIQKYWYNIVVFDIQDDLGDSFDSDLSNADKAKDGQSENPAYIYISQKLNNLAGISKWWKIVDIDELDLKGKTVWTNDDDFGMELKKKYWADRKSVV